jgi:hypothetical protein
LEPDSSRLITSTDSLTTPARQGKEFNKKEVPLVASVILAASIVLILLYNLRSK